MRIDKQFPGVGRIRKSSGTTDKAMNSALLSMLDVLFSRGRLDVLEAIRDGRLHPMTVWRHFDNLENLPSPEKMTPLDPDAFEWARGCRKTPKHRNSLLSSFRRLLEGSDRATAGDLPELLRRFQDQNGDKPRQCNLVRSAVQAYLKARMGKRHQLYQAVCDIEPLEYRPGKPHPVTPEELVAITAQMSQPHVSMLWILARTGMRPKEFWEKQWWIDDISGDRLHINGTKTRAANRSVPLICDVFGPMCSQAVLNRALQKIRPEMALYDMRRSYSLWLEAAGIVQSRIKAYMGHGPGDVTEGYQRHEVAPHIPNDAKLLREYIGISARQVRTG